MKANTIKGIRKLRVYDIPVDVYDREIHLYVGANMEDARRAANIEFKDLKLEAEHIQGNIACAIRHIEGGFEVPIMLIGMDRVQPKALYPLLAHEATHLSWYILDIVGVDIDADNHEAQAYLLEHIFKYCKYGVEDYIKAYKLKIKL